ncbi:MAG TPA: MarR family transcriptional regulator [Conexibacter sp.]|nr:MarR family transcriptional regulator [Conexibacter sp.]
MPDSERLYFRLNLAAHRLRVLADQRLLAAAGITAAQAGVLLIVADADGPVRQRDLARLLRQRESAVTTMVERLTAAGLLARERPPADARAWVLTLTAAGERALAAVRTAADALNAEAFAGLDGRERAAFAAALERVLGNVAEG